MAVPISVSGEPPVGLPDPSALAAAPGARGRKPLNRLTTAIRRNRKATVGVILLLLFTLIALFPGLIAMLLYYRGLRTTPAPVATLAELAFPATALIVNYFALGATVSGAQLLGFAILWATIAMLHRLPVRVEPGATAPQPA